MGRTQAWHAEKKLSHTLCSHSSLVGEDMLVRIWRYTVADSNYNTYNSDCTKKLHTRHRNTCCLPRSFLLGRGRSFLQTDMQFVVSYWQDALSIVCVCVCVCVSKPGASACRNFSWISKPFPLSVQFVLHLLMYGTIHQLYKYGLYTMHDR